MKLSKRILSILLALVMVLSLLPATLLASADEPERSYVKVTSTDDLEDGWYLIVYEEGNVAFNGKLATLDATNNTVAVTVAENTIASTETIGKAAFQFSKANGSFLGQGGKYVGRGTDRNGLDNSATELTNTVSIDDDGNAVVLGTGGAYLRFNAASNQNRFRYYSSGTYTNQKPIALYKLVGADTPVDPPYNPAKPDAENIAPKATASSLYAASWNNVAGVNDGNVPASSNGTYNESYGSWGQNTDCADEPVTLTWNTEVEIQGAGAFFWHDGSPDDRSGIDFPVSYTYEYLDADGVTWKPVENTDGLRVYEDIVCITTFDTITTTALRIMMAKENTGATYGLGLNEFEVYGKLLALDTVALETAIAAAEAIDLANYTDETAAALSEALAAAQAVLAKEDKTQAEIDAAAAALEAAIAGLKIKPVEKPAEPNIAPQGTATAEYCASWNSVAGVNDGDIPAQSNGNQAGAYGSWGANNNANPEPITITFEKEAEITGAGMYFWTDQADPFNASGINFPKSYTFEYLDGEEWKPVANAKGMDNAADVVNYTVFDKVTTTALRVMMNKATTGSFGLGVAEFEIYGKLQEQGLDTSALEAAITAAKAVEAEKYTEESVAALNEALAAAEAVLAKEDATQEEIDAAAETLNNAIAALVEKPVEPEVPSYELAALEDLNANDTYIITVFRYFAGTNADSHNAYVFNGENNKCGGVNGAAAEDYSTLAVETPFAETAQWKIVPVDGGLTIQNVATGKYLGNAIPAASDEPVTLLTATGAVNGVTNYGLGYDASHYLRYSGSSDSFSWSSGSLSGAPTSTNACNVLFYKVVTGGGDEPSAEPVQLFAGSDIQGADDWNKHLDNIARNAKEAGHDIDVSFWCGDYADGSVYADGSDTSATETPQRIQYIKDTLNAYWPELSDFHFAQGNHDGSQHIGTVIDPTGAYEYDDFVLYQINEDDFPWWQAGYMTYSDEDVCLEKINATTATLAAYLDELIAKEDQRVIFIYTHVPLHWSSRTTTANSWWSDNIHADILFNMINEKAEKLDIVFLYGHNHSENYAEAYPDGGSVNFFAPGDTIRIPNGQVAASGNYTEETIKFTYLNAGYVGKIAAGFVPATATASVITVTPEKVLFTRYSDEGHYEGSDRELIRNNRGEYPAYLNLNSVENPKVRKEGDTEHFQAVLKNAEAASYTWSVEGSGEVAEGQGTDTAAILYTGGGEVVVKVSVTYVDSEGETQTLEQTKTVEVKAAPAQGEITYNEVKAIADLAEGKQYAIVVWRYFGGSNDDTFNGYGFGSTNAPAYRAPTEDNYETIKPEAELTDDQLWEIVPVEGGVTLKNLGTGKYLAEAIPAAADEPYTLTIAEGECNGVYNMAIGTASGSIRYSNSSGTFAYSSTAPAGEVTRAYAANITIYEKVVPQKVYPNIAPSGTASSDFCASWSSVAGVNDEVIPDSSNPGYDYNEAYGSWGKNSNSAPETILITFEQPAKLFGAGAFFWYNADGPHNQNGIDIPASYIWEYQNEDGEWVAFPNAAGFGIEEDIMNQTTFDPVIAYVVRINMQKSTTGSYGLGVAELELYGEFVTPVDTAALKAAIEAAEAIEDLEPYTEDSVAALHEALEAAKAVLANVDKTQEEVDAAAAALTAAIEGLTEKPLPNIAPEAINVEAPYCASWNNLAGVNDGVIPSASNTAGDNTAYGSWRSNGTADPEYITFTFEKPAEIRGASSYFLYNENSPHEQYGIDFPDAYTYEYLNAAGEWVEVPNALGYGLEEDILNQTSFDSIVTTAFRIVMQRQAGAFGLGVGEIEIYGQYVTEYVDKAALAEAVAAAEALTETDYTPETWAPLAEALAAGKAVLENEEATQEEVDAAAAAINEAIEALIDKVQAVIDLIDAIEEPVDLDDKDAIEAARAAYDALTDEEKERVTNYADLLLAEVAYYQALAAKYEEEEEAYLEQAAQAFQEAKQAAIDALTEYLEHAKQDHDEEHVAAAEVALAEAIAAIEAAEDSEALRQAIDEGIAAIDEALRGGLILPVDKSELEAAVAEAEELNPADYTDESAAALEEAIENAKAVLEDEDATQEEVDEALAALEEAIENLEEKPDVDKSELEAAVAEAEELNLEDYTDESAAALEEAIENAKTVLEDENATQEEVDEALADLKEAIENLEEKEPFRFDDVMDESQYYFVPVYWAYNHEPQITAGTSPNLFSPNATCTRAQVVTFLWRAAGTPEPETENNPFTDVKADQYYYNAVLWAVENEVTAGTSPTTFTPNGKCTRAQIVTFLYRFAGEPEISGENPFTDVTEKQYYYNAVLWAVANEVTQGTSATKFSPNNPCTRGQVVTFLYRYLAE